MKYLRYYLLFMIFIICTVSVSAELINPGWVRVSLESGNSQLNGEKIVVGAQSICINNITLMSGSTVKRVAIVNSSNVWLYNTTNLTSGTFYFNTCYPLTAGTYYVGFDGNGSTKDSALDNTGITFPYVYNQLNITGAAYYSGGTWTTLTNQAYDMAYMTVSNVTNVTAPTYNGSIIYPLNTSIKTIYPFTTLNIAVNLTKNNISLTNNIDFFNITLYNSNSSYRLLINNVTTTTQTPTLSLLGSLARPAEDLSTCYDSDNDKLFVRMGHDKDPWSTTGEIYLYNYTTSSWVNITNNSASHPYGVGGYGFYDPKKKLCIFLLRVGTQNSADSSNDPEEWTFNTTTYTYTNVTDSSATRITYNADFKEMCYDANRNGLFTFGNNYGSTSAKTTELWFWNLTSNKWSNFTSQQSVTTPSKRIYYGLVNEYKSNTCLLIGGEDGNGATFYNDTWEFNFTNTSWKQVTFTFNSTFAGRSMIEPAYDTQRNKTIIIGGRKGSTIDNTTNSKDVWECDYSLLTCNLTAQLNDGTAEMPSVYATQNQSVYVMGGWTGSNLYTARSYRYYVTSAYTTYNDTLYNNTDKLWYINTTIPSIQSIGLYSLNVSANYTADSYTFNLTSLNSMNGSNVTTFSYNQTSPSNNTFLLSNKPIFSFNATIQGVWNVTLFVNNTAQKTISVTTSNTSGSITPTNNINNGQYVWYFNATDGIQNIISESRIINIGASGGTSCIIYLGNAYFRPNICTDT